jgi:predicted MFS family arabinose efflux permease
VLTILIGIVATEEMSSESRAWAISVLALAAGLGAGIALAALPIADLGAGSWRIIYAISLVWIFLAIILQRKMPETRRFIEHHEKHLRSATHIDISRLLTQSLVAIFGNIFIAASSVFQIRYLRDVRDYSAIMITAFTLITGTPASIGLLVGGRVADSRGRRLLSAIAFPLGAIFLTFAFSTSGKPMWLASLTGGICLGLAYPAMAVYRGEMFPTLHRSFASGVIMTASLIGGSIGLLGAGYFLNRDISYGTVMGWLALGPVVAGILIYTTFPESAHRELEELNPQDLTTAKP